MVDKEKMVRNRMNERVRQEVINATVYFDAYMLNVCTFTRLPSTQD